MFSYQLYNVVHIVGIVLLMAGLSGMATATSGAGADGRSVLPRWLRRTLAGFHGLGVFLILLGGFGMLARIGIVQGSAWPGWVWGKVLIWGALTISALLPYRFPRTALPLLLLLPALGGVAAWLAIYKPI